MAEPTSVTNSEKYTKVEFEGAKAFEDPKDATDYKYYYIGDHPDNKIYAKLERKYPIENNDKFKYKYELFDDSGRKYSAYEIYTKNQERVGGKAKRPEAKRPNRKSRNQKRRIRKSRRTRRR